MTKREELLLESARLREMEAELFIRRRKFLRYTVIFSVCATAALLGFVATTYAKLASPSMSREELAKLLVTVFSAFLALAVFTSSLVLLRSEKPRGSGLEVGSLHYSMRRLEKLTDEVSRLLLSRELKMDVKFREEIHSQIRDTLTKDAIEAMREHYGLVKIESILSGTKARISNAIETLGARTNLNLIIGVFVALSGFVVLGFFLYNSPTSPSAESQVVYFLPRLTTVILLEVFSYFFLDLYRAGLVDLKYYQNEQTNIETREAGLHAALTKGNEELLISVVSELSSTDRNSLIPVEKKRSKENTSKDPKVALEALSKIESVVKSFQ